MLLIVGGVIAGGALAVVAGLVGSALGVAGPSPGSSSAPEWLQGLANLGLVFAALFAGWAAWIARRSFTSQREAALEELELRRQALEGTRHQESMVLLLRFNDMWQRDKMLRWRQELASGLLWRERHGRELGTWALLAFGEIANLVEAVGYCVRHGLLVEEDAWNEFSVFWQMYWQACTDQVDSLDDPTSWENAQWLIARFVEREPTVFGPAEVHSFLVGERNIALVEERVLGGRTPGLWRRLWHQLRIRAKRVD